MAPRTYRRTKTTTNYKKCPKRPIDKSLVTIGMETMVPGTQYQGFISPAATFPCTITGLQWDIIFTNANTATTNHQLTQFMWAIVVIREGMQAAVMQNTAGAGVVATGSFYKPEQNCLVFGQGLVDNWGSNTNPNNGAVEHYMGKTKTMRKLQKGDQIAFVFTGNAVTANPNMICKGIFMYWTKS